MLTALWGGIALKELNEVGERVGRERLEAFILYCSA